MQSSTRCFKNITLFRNIHEYHVRSINFLYFVQVKLLGVHNFLVEMFTKLLLLILVKPFFKLYFECIVLFPSLQISKTTQTSDWCFVCVQNIFAKMDFSTYKTISHRKFHSGRKFFTKDGIRSKHCSCIFAKVPGRFKKLWDAFAFSSFRNLAVGCVEI